MIPLPSGVRVWLATGHTDILVFVTSPKRETPYHIDRECDFLLEILDGTYALIARISSAAIRKL